MLNSEKETFEVKNIEVSKDDVTKAKKDKAIKMLKKTAIIMTSLIVGCSAVQTMKFENGNLIADAIVSSAVLIGSIKLNILNSKNFKESEEKDKVKLASAIAVMNLGLTVPAIITGVSTIGVTFPYYISEFSSLIAGFAALAGSVNIFGENIIKLPKSEEKVKKL